MGMKSTAMGAVPMKKGTMKSTAMKKAAMKKKAVSKVAVGRLAKQAVFSGRKVRTSGGLTKDSLVRSKTGKIVSKKASFRAKRVFATGKLRVWAAAVKKARGALGIKGFVPVGGPSAGGKALLAKVKSFLA